MIRDKPLSDAQLVPASGESATDFAGETGSCLCTPNETNMQALKKKMTQVNTINVWVLEVIPFIL